MTKKDFIQAAQDFRGLKPSDPANLPGWRKVIDNLCVVFAKDNPRFDPIRFKTACGY